MSRAACALLACALALSAAGGAVPGRGALAPWQAAERVAAQVLGLTDADSLEGFVAAALALQGLGATPGAAAGPASPREAVAQVIASHAAAEAAWNSGPWGRAATLLSLARAVDALLGWRGALPAQGGPCGVLDARPVLCVAGEGPDAHADEAAVLVDLGGDDLYEGRGAGAGPGEVRVLVDLAGDDVYTASLAAGGAAQGAGLGGAGILWDRSGNDSYTCLAGAGRSACQGAAQLEGVGLLLDGGGFDRYVARAVAPGEPLSATTLRSADVVLAAQGAAAHPDPGYNPERFHQALGVLADAAGDDAYDAWAQSGFDVAAPWSFALQGTTTLAAQGAGVDAAGALADLSGNDSYAAYARGGTTHCAAQGSALFIAQGHLADGAGDDIYRARCGEWLAVDAPPGVAVAQPGGWVNAAQQGAAQYSLVRGVTSVPMSALLADLGGHDRYEALAAQVVIANSTLRAQAWTHVLWANQQGAGLEGEATLLDKEGWDSYSLAVLAIARANSPTGHAGAQTAEVYVHGQGAGGYGSGALLDLGGSDSYLALADTEASITGQPLGIPPGGTYEGTVHIGVQGAGDQRVQSVDQEGLGLLLDADGGLPDSFVSTPYDPTCQPPVVPRETYLAPSLVRQLLQQLPRAPVGGERGSALWFDCDPGGVGLLL